MKARPILMHGRSVRNLLAGRKTQTRRIMKPQPPEDTASICGPEWFEPEVFDRYGESMPGKPVFGIYDEDGEWGIKSPKGAPGDLLYVREMFCFQAEPDGGLTGGIIYGATHEGPIDKLDENGNVIDGASPWRPSIHMPRWASRITLRLTDVRVELVQEISEADAIAEGCRPFFDHDNPDVVPTPDGDIEMAPLRDPVCAFAGLWDDTNGAGAWDRNDWVWALTFDAIHANVDDVLADPARYGIPEAA